MEIAVVIPTYNRFAFLAQALRSVYAQSYLPKEVIVVDDGSEDNTAEITKEFPQIKYIFQKNRGVSAARNLGVQSASCEWIAFLDSDDRWESQKLAMHRSYHEKYPEIKMSYTDERWIRNDQEIHVPKKYQKVQEDLFEKSLKHCIIAPSSSLLHRSLFEDVGFFDEDLEVCEDYDLWLRIASKYEIGLIGEKLIQKYAGHPEQLSLKHWGMDRFRVLALEKLLMLHPEHTKKEEIVFVLQKKYQLLLQGAIKYNKTQSKKIYEEKLQKYCIF